MNTEALEPHDPDHPYNQALSQGVRPENFGLKNNITLGEIVRKTQ